MSTNTQYTTKNIENFWRRVDKRGPDDCWPWLGYRMSSGHGRVSMNNTRYLSHRVAYELANGPIQPNLVVRHICNFSPCCNPAHLRIGTQADNMRDMAQNREPIKRVYSSRTDASVKPTESDRFYAKVSKTPTETGCFQWEGCLNEHGYGIFYFRGKPALAHRVAWEFEHGEIPDGLVAMHICDTPSCVRVSHLKLGTQIDNIRDRTAKNRSNRVPTAIGENVKNAKLTKVQVLEIRSERYADWTGKDIAVHFGVSRALVSLILNRKIWKHI